MKRVAALPLMLLVLMLLLAALDERRAGAQSGETDRSAFRAASDVAGSQVHEHVELRPETPSTFLLVTPSLGHPLEREPDVAAASPSYRSAIMRDAHTRWREAIPLYQRALAELASRYRVQPSERLEAAMAKVDLERERSALLARLDERSAGGTRTNVDRSRRAYLARGRLLRLKLMSVRAETGRAAVALLAETEAALRRAAEKKSDTADDPTAGIEMREARLLLCATYAVSGDRRGAEAELAAASKTARHDPAHALSLAACLVALGLREEAVGALASAVAVQTQRPSTWSSGELGVERDLHLANDWDPLRRDPRFEPLFRP